MSGRAPHEVLGLSESATMDQIRKRYYHLAKIHHPDRPGGNAGKFVEINHAYESLCGGVMAGAGSGRAMGSADFGSWFTNFSSEDQPTVDNRTHDVIYTLLVKPGRTGQRLQIPHVQSTVTFRHVHCATCHGTGYVGTRTKFVCRACVDQREVGTQKEFLLQAEIPDNLSEGCVFVYEKMALIHPDKITGDVVIVAELATEVSVSDHQIVPELQDLVEQEQARRRVKNVKAGAAATAVVFTISATLLVPSGGISIPIGVAVWSGLGAYAYFAGFLSSHVREEDYEKVWPSRTDDPQIYRVPKNPQTFSLFDDHEVAFPESQLQRLPVMKTFMDL